MMSEAAPLQMADDSQWIHEKQGFLYFHSISALSGTINILGIRVKHVPIFNVNDRTRITYYVPYRHTSHIGLYQ